ncbi:GH32 C-terminal domain-containing protein [Clostridium felsineum]|uniref:glycoside hydrolase family 32 protein n=1 Tax=Clostridium felsineum TaxID=36839 RepID=UPI00214D30CE|nr:glycoside hydrolase family 32 protein [Clostridium felsineum]MCR3759612.1 GH32 C-terminal domain-containing protein [Clostridium felsineum]
MKSKRLIALTLSISIFFVLGNGTITKANATSSSTTTYRTEELRPQYHYTPDNGWMNDPNGMVYYHGQYHLFYQYNPQSTVWGPMHWGHAVSKDLVNWKQEPIALAPDKNGDIFSGSVVVDWNNRSGLFNNTPDHTGLVAFFTNNGATQCESMAYSTDEGKTWTEYGNNPVIPQPANTPDFRDPKVSWDNVHNKWVMTVAAGNKIQFYSSSNLKEWAYTGEFGAEGEASHAGVWECPDLYQMPVSGENGKSKWVLSINMGASATIDSPPAKGSGMMYVVGDFDGNKFVADPKYIANNNVGNNDSISGYYLLPGDTIKVYHSRTGGNELGEATVPAGKSSVNIQLNKKLSSGDGRVWISLVRNGVPGSRQEIHYLGEDTETNSNTQAASGKDILNPGFETGNLSGWTATGNEWTNKNVTDNTTWWGGVFNQSGKYHCWGFADPAIGGSGDAGTGILESSQFTLGGSGEINFLVGGGDDMKNLYVTLETADGKELNQFKASGTNSESYRRVVWDASAYIGQKLRIKVVDKSTGGWGHINVDDFHVYNTKNNVQSSTDLYPINWVDYGPDFYAGVTWNDTTLQDDVSRFKYGNHVPDGRRILLGWMSNWEYAGNTPTSTWRGSDSIPREEKLVDTSDGYKILQQPVENLKSLRKAPAKILTNTKVQSGSNLLSGISEDSYEITSKFNVNSTTAKEFGFKVRESDKQETTIGYNPETSTLFLDRSKSDSFNYPEYMPLKQQAPLKPDSNGNVEIQIFVDKGSVEVFGNNGLVSITDQIFSSDSSKGMELYSTGGGTHLDSLVVYPLKSAKFTPYIKPLAYNPNTVPRNILNGNFESGKLNGWTQTSGGVNTFTVSSDESTCDPNDKYFLSSGKNGNTNTGVLQSNYFKLSGNGQISLSVAGGNASDREYVALCDGATDRELFEATGNNNEIFQKVQWDASKYLGKVLYMKVVDYNWDNWGHINVRNIKIN